MRVVMALGGNALLRRGERPDPAMQRRNVATAIAAIAPIARRHQVVITHGNGPQIGLLAQQSDRPDPLDILGAETEGMIGYMIEAELANQLRDRDVAAVLTCVEVDRGDPAFAMPDKPVGRLFSEGGARKLAARYDWSVAREEAGWRRVVPSPQPKRIRDIRAIKLLLEGGVLVICAGGGGIPVAVGEDGSIHGVEAVIDKDRTSALLAEELTADILLFLTDEPGVWPFWPNRKGLPLSRVSPSELRDMAFEPGTMGPKVEAAGRFVERTGRTARIGAIEDAEKIFTGERGTIVSVA